LETLTSTKFDWKKVLVVTMLVILAGVTTAGITWYMMDARNAEENELSQSEIASLKLRVSELESGQEEMINPEDCDCDATEEDDMDDEDQTETETETEDGTTPTPIVPTQ
jgi:hypothetical protein